MAAVTGQPAVERMSISAQFEQLEAEVASFHELLDRHTAQLAPVLNPNDRKAGGSDPIPQLNNLSSVGLRIISLTASVYELRLMLLDLNQRLSL